MDKYKDMDTIFFFNLLRIREFFTPRPTTFFIKPSAGGYKPDYQNFNPPSPLIVREKRTLSILYLYRVLWAIKTTFIVPVKVNPIR